MNGRKGFLRTGVLLCCLVAMFLVGCGTTRGVGQDTQSLGRNIEKLGK